MRATPFRPLFLFGVARGGTNLVARMLGAHPRIEIMLDPLPPVFRSFRNAIVRRGWEDSIRTADPGAPLQDYYGGSDGIRLLDLVLSSDLSFDLDEGAAPALRAELVERAALESPRHATRLGESVAPTTGERWKGNSSFEADSARITPRPVGRWRRSPDDPHVRAVEFVCGPEMALCEYPAGRRDFPEDGVLDYFLEASSKAAKWRSDSGDVIADFGLELFRRAALRLGADRLDEDTVRRRFLFRWAFDEIRAREGRLP